jgi:hypothetical protein
MNVLMAVRHPVILQVLIDVAVENGVDMIDDKSAAGFTAVRYQRLAKNEDAVKCLLDNGATPEEGSVYSTDPHSISRFIADWGDKTVTDKEILCERDYNAHLEESDRGLTVYDLVHIAEQLKIPVSKPYSVTSLLKLVVSKRPRE